MKLLTCLVFIFAFLERTFFDLGPNVELVTLSMLLAIIYLPQKLALTLTLVTLVLSDLVIGNTSIFLFTWTGFLLPLLFLKGLKRSKYNPIFASTAAGAGSNLFFFLWTNFGVWILDSWGMYANNASGLISSYINGLPFLKLQLASTLFFVPLVFTAVRFFPGISIHTRKLFSHFVPLKNL